MGGQTEVVNIVQKQDNWECICCPPCALTTNPNQYFIEKGGNQELCIDEKDNCFCQKCCYPGARAYEADIFPRPGVRYLAQRDFALASCCGACPCWMPKVKVSNASGAVIGVIEQDCCPVYMCKY